MGLRKKIDYSSYEEHENDELWAISYGDMITLLLSFFVIFFSTDFKKNQNDKIDSHLISSFKTLDFGSKEIRVDQSTNSPVGVNKEAKFVSVPEIETLNNVKIHKIGDRMIVTFDQMNFFKTAEIEPNEKGTQELEAFAKKFVPYSSLYKISVKAFTDNRPVKHGNRFIDNMELSALRALAALRVLQKAGIPLDSLEIAGYGEMNKLYSLLTPEKLKELSNSEIQDISRTIVLIIKHETEPSLL